MWICKKNCLHEILAAVAYFNISSLAAAVYWKGKIGTTVHGTRWPTFSHQVCKASLKFGNPFSWVLARVNIYGKADQDCIRNLLTQTITRIIFTFFHFTKIRWAPLALSESKSLMWFGYGFESVFNNPIPIHLWCRMFFQYFTECNLGLTLNFDYCTLSEKRVIHAHKTVIKTV